MKNLDLKRKHWIASPGFTLVEVMVSASLGTAIILVMLTAMVAGTRGFDESTRRIDALVEARAALGILSDDVASMIPLPGDEFGWFRSDDRFQEVWFMTLKPTDAQEADKAVGDVCFVHYFTAVTPDAPFEGAAVSRKLYRQFINSRDLVANLEMRQLPEAEADPENAEVIAFNVTRFVAQPLQRPVRGGSMIEWSPGNGAPQSLRVDFQVIDGDTADLFRGEDDWNLVSNLSRDLVVENENGASVRGRDFRMNLKIGHAN